MGEDFHVPWVKGTVLRVSPRLTEVSFDGVESVWAFPDASVLKKVEEAEEVSTPALKDTNPKDGIGATKVPLHLVPATATAMAALAHLDGALKYGKWNWRVAGVRASIYVDAARRHLDKWFNGEDIDPDNGLPHLAMAMACLNIIVDAMACGKLTDDRPPKVDLGGFMDELTPHVSRLTEKHKDKNPRHWNIEDSPL